MRPRSKDESPSDNYSVKKKKTQITKETRKQGWGRGDLLIT